jgi:hypothetical protein
MAELIPRGVRVDDEDRWLLEQFRWRKRSDGYVIRSLYIGWIDGAYRYKRLYLHRLIMNASPGDIVDHINGDRLDNRRCNLRVVTQHINMQNRSLRPHARNTSGYRGVVWDKRRRKWAARAKTNGKQHFIGYFSERELAAEAAHRWRLDNMPGYAEVVDPTALQKYREIAKQPGAKPRPPSPPVLCACGCQRIVRNPSRARFAHGGRPARPHGTLPAGGKIDDSDRHLLFGRSWHVTNNGYVAARINNKIVLLHRLLTKAPPELVVDHINGDRLDNRRVNLRLISQSLNSQNQRLSAANSSGFRGVVWDKARRKWVAQAKLDGRNVSIGRFDTLEQAATAAHQWRLATMTAYEPSRYGQSS